MILFDQILQQQYAANDAILKGLQEAHQTGDEAFISHRWLLDSLPKRMIYQYMYGDLLIPSATPRRVLDVGGGYCSLSRWLAQYNDYTLLDFMVHDTPEMLRRVEKFLNKPFWQYGDWYEFEITGQYDLIIANDLFPNVDQRLDLFIEKFLPFCREMRLSLTYYNVPRFYKVKRSDGDELFHIVAWNGHQVKQVLEKYEPYIIEPSFDLLQENPPSLFANQRQICMIALKGS